MAWIKRGLMAGAAGTATLNAVTYLDMLVRGRAESDAPGQVVDAALAALDRELPGDAGERDHRRTALGALSGIASGLGIGVVASGLRAAGLHLAGGLGPVVTGAAAMAATNGPMAAAGLTDPRTWTRADWVADAVPHLAYGVAAHAVIRAQDPPPGSPDAPVRAGFGLTARSFALGTAAGMRASLGLAAPGLIGRPSGSIGTLGGLTRVAGVAGELVGDKLPSTPSRLEPPGLYVRFVSGAGGALALARRDHAAPAWPVIAGVAGAAVGAYGGAAWRRTSAASRADWHGAVAEDAVALLLAVVACKGS